MTSIRNAFHRIRNNLADRSGIVTRQLIHIPPRICCFDKKSESFLPSKSTSARPTILQMQPGLRSLNSEPSMWLSSLVKSCRVRWGFFHLPRSGVTLLGVEFDTYAEPKGILSNSVCVYEDRSNLDCVIIFLRPLREIGQLAGSS